MAKNISEQEVRQTLSKIKHPAIDHTLLELGIIKAINVESGKATIILAFPFPNIPIKDHLINSVREPIEKLGVEVEIKATVMTQEKLQRFLAMEQDAWKGGT
jgi:ATP-binding protein involved in chromosome partitioning